MNSKTNRSFSTVAEHIFIKKFKGNVETYIEYTINKCLETANRNIERLTKEIKEWEEQKDILENI